MNRRALVAVVLFLGACNPPPVVVATSTTYPPYRDLPPPLQAPTTTTTMPTTTVPPRQPGVTNPTKTFGQMSHVSSTAYCETGRMANGQHTYLGAVAANRWALGTILQVSDGPLGPGLYTVTDRIGHGSQLDFAIPGDCPAARRWGRRTVTVIGHSLPL